MAIDPRISLAANTVDTSQVFANALNNIRSQDAINQQRIIDPIRNEMLQRQNELQAAQQPAQLQAAQQAGNPFSQLSVDQQQRAQIIGQFSVGAANHLDKPDFIRQKAQEAAQFLMQRGGDASDFNQLLSMSNEDLVRNVQEDAQDFLRLTGGGGGKSVNQREREDALSVLAKDPKMNTNEGKEAAIFLGLAPKAKISAAEQIALSEDLTSKVAKSQANIEGAKATAKEEATLSARKKLQPELEEAIAQAKTVGAAKGEEIATFPKALSSLRSGLQNADNVISKTRDALSKIGFFSTGFIGKALSNLPNSDAFALRKTVETIQANLGFDRLQQMRNDSKTGGALGNVSERELDLLISSVQNLDVGQSDAQLSKNLAQVITHYEQYKKNQLDDVNALSQRVGETNKPSGFQSLWGN